MSCPALNKVVLAALVLLLVTTVVSAIDQDTRDHKIYLEPIGVTTTDTTSVDLSNGEMNFTEHQTGASLKTKTKIDGEIFSPDATVTTNGEKKFARAAAEQPEPKQIGEVVSDIVYKAVTLGGTKPGEIEQIGGITPDVTISYIYTGNSVKETIVLQQDAELSFPVTIPAGQKMIHIGPDNWKIVNATNGNTMVGFVAASPFGVDAAGRNIFMNYSWDGSELHLNYNRTITVFNFETNKSENLDITYPLTIDPTWTYETDHWKGYVISGGKNYTVLKWNATGTTSWTTPDTGGNLILEYLVVGGGGAGGKGYDSDSYEGGGGAGGFYNNSELVSNATSLTITVGAGGTSGGYGENSVLGGYTVYGGGRGGLGDTHYSPTHCTAGGNGGSGGGGVPGNECSNSAGSAINASRGYSGGVGYRGTNWEGGAGGGGGAGGAGTAGDMYYSGAGGNGKYNNLTGDNTKYACGGGAYSRYGSSSSGGCTGAGAGGNGGGVATNGYGHGGGGTYSSGAGTGGSGIIIVRYLTPIPPVASFNVVGYNGVAPDEVQMQDLSSGVIQSWNWSYRNVTGNDTEIWWSTQQNPIVTFGVGNWSIKLNVTSGNGTNISSQVTYINVSPAYVPPPPTAIFEVNYYEGVAPDALQLVDTSTGSPTYWNWSYRNVTGNNTEIWFSNQQYPWVTFGIGNWSIRLNASNTGGSNISAQITYLNISTAPPTPTPTPTPVPTAGVGALSIDGYVKDAETTDMIENATVTVLQGVINITKVTNGTGYYFASDWSLAPGSQIITVVSAPGYETYSNTSTPQGIYGIFRINQTLLSLTPAHTGNTLGGIVRLPPFNQTVDDATISMNYTAGESTYNYTVTTNSAGYYVQTNLSSGYYGYYVWGSKSGLVNSSVYYVMIGAAE